MKTLACRDIGYSRDYVARGETEEDLLKNGAEHAIQVHGMNADDIYLNRIPANFLCQSIPKLEDDLV
jgi:predicted small metal-binding protein